MLPGGVELPVGHILVSGDEAVVALCSNATAGGGPRFDNRHCRVCRFDGETIVEVRAYPDSWLVGELFRRNPI